MKNLKTIEAKVKAILKKNEDARNDDMTLYLIVIYYSYSCGPLYRADALKIIFL